MKKINIEKDLVEYDGVWIKKDKNNLCSQFTMADLRQILKERKEETKKEMEWKIVRKDFREAKKEFKKLKKIIKKL